ncbi:RND transporter [Paenibacillus chitinolyticus]|uniref:Biotin/lipoyl-binding protein n=1 Tax=Paenibacillus chitinolyticus TaxID=79263 RepID=A0A410X402_9BACL|nr:biotin/lipoyl-binding protein [Paenibacillus chitinolyticus]MCY9593330.1 biotin/lipoyl-binding protein [Paenibacillus chitinolyticus]MCY9599881.1 biotin/lipoyl-binding protein [Paenibacillus chitinolyticus]QAV21342.1 RND transporter [Paenibacillus chitinolyticus]
MEQEASKDLKRKRNIRIIAGLFIGGLILFTLFSNTLQALTLPKVRTESAVYGSLVHTLEGTGVLRPLAEEKLSNSAGWKVKAVLVKEGDRVKKGQKLVSYDSKSAERELQDETTQLEKLKIELQNAQDQFIAASTEGDELKVRSVTREMETRKLDISMQERKVTGLREALADQKDLAAPFEGVITKVNASAGTKPAGEPEIVIADSAKGYRFEFAADAALLTSLGITAGTKIEVGLGTPDQQPRLIEGTVEETAEAEPLAAGSSGAEAGESGGRTAARKSLRIQVEGPELKGGDRAVVKLTKRSVQQGFKVSSDAVHQERDGKFIYKIEEQKGALGNVFVVRRVPVRSSETNESETVIQSDSLNEKDLIILKSSEPLQDNNRVRLQ